MRSKAVTRACRPSQGRTAAARGAGVMEAGAGRAGTNAVTLSFSATVEAGDYSIRLARRISFVLPPMFVRALREPHL